MNTGPTVGEFGLAPKLAQILATIDQNPDFGHRSRRQQQLLLPGILSNPPDLAREERLTAAKSCTDTGFLGIVTGS